MCPRIVNVHVRANMEFEVLNEVNQNDVYQNVGVMEGDNVVGKALGSTISTNDLPVVL